MLNGALAHCLIVDHVYQIIEYEPNPCFRQFGESVSAARRAGDEDPEKSCEIGVEMAAKSCAILKRYEFLGETPPNVHHMNLAD